MRKTGKKFPKYFSAIFSVVAVLAYLAGAYRPLERIWHDRSFSHRAESLKLADPRLLLVAMDEDTVKKHGFPLPRVVHAQLIDKLKALGVKTVIFDVMFFEKREGDAELVAATKRHGGVIHAFTSESLAETNALGDMSRHQLPIFGLQKTSWGLGSVIIASHLESDGHMRTFSLFNGETKDPVRVKQPTASLAAVGLAHFQDTTVDALNARYGGANPEVMIKNFRRPVRQLLHEKADEAWLKLTPEQQDKSSAETLDSAFRRISIMDILSGSLTKAQLAALKGGLAIVGSTTVGYYDHYPDPFTSQSPGAEHHLIALDNVLHGDYLKYPSLAAVLALIFLGAWLPFFYVTYLPNAAAAAASAGTLVLGLLVSSRMMTHGMMFYPVAPGLAMIVSFLALTVDRVRSEGRDKELIKAKFGQFVSPEIVEELANDPEKAKLGAQKREMTVLFLDIAHFTTISEKMGPEALMAFLNKYLSALSEVMLDRRGTIDKYIGDCIMAFWNAPLENKSHAADAVLSALHCQKAIDELNKDLDPGMPEIPAIRIGINTGHMNVGFTGTERKLAYTVIGDEVNLASRLEGANKFFGSKIIISAATFEGAKDVIDARYLGRARVVGKATPVPVYEPLSEKGKLPEAWLKALPVWEKGVGAFYGKKYEEALAAFTEFGALMPADGPGELYRNISRDYAALPPDDWDQVFNLTAK